MSTPVLVICGSASDLGTVEAALAELDSLQIGYELRVLSAHRTPDAVTALAKSAQVDGFEVVIAAAGLAAHLPGVVAAHTRLPVIGLPIAAGPLAGTDALHSVVQMPPGVPVLTVGIGNAKNAALAAARILALTDPGVADRLAAATRAMRDAATAADHEHARTSGQSAQETPAHA